MSQTLIPAADLFPAAFDSTSPEWFLSIKQLPEDNAQKFYLTSPFQSGWKYFTKSKEYRVFKERPPASVYETEIGTKYQSEESDKPMSFIFCRAWHVEAAKMVCLVIDSNIAAKALSEEFRENSNLYYINDDPALPHAIVSNFYVELKKAGPKAPPMLKYSARCFLRATENPEILAQAKLLWYPEQVYANANPFEAAAAPPAAAGVPVTAPPAPAPAPVTPEPTPAPAPAPATTATPPVW